MSSYTLVAFLVGVVIQILGIVAAKSPPELADREKLLKEKGHSASGWPVGHEDPVRNLVQHQMLLHTQRFYHTIDLIRTFTLIIVAVLAFALAVSVLIVPGPAIDGASAEVLEQVKHYLNLRAAWVFSIAYLSFAILGAAPAAFGRTFAHLFAVCYPDTTSTWESPEANSVAVSEQRVVPAQPKGATRRTKKRGTRSQQELPLTPEEIAEEEPVSANVSETEVHSEDPA